jgi:uncharacterized membrane protein (UPF0127 family)
MLRTSWSRAPFVAALFLCCVLLAPAQAQTAPQKLPTVQLNAGMHLITAEVAKTPQQRAIGLMHRERMGANEGMLFIFEQPSVQCFWMKNTLLPLSIAFLADDGRVVKIDEMQPQSLQEHCSGEPARYALEMNQGWFEKRGVKAGDHIGGGPFAR